MQKFVRQQILNQRKRITPNARQRYHQAIADAFSTLFPRCHGLKIASYLAMDDEADPALIEHHIKRTCKEIYHPILHPFRKRMMLFGSADKPRCLNRFHIEEPCFDADDVIAPWELDVVLMPLVAFDGNRHRIGMGGGFYDSSFHFRRFHHTPLLIGIAYDEQRLDAIAKNEWDIIMDKIITPSGIIG
ncbi:MAG: 5-formyltetrahydrofolate cyclo-ligase [Francisellaceae bacterium]